MGSGVCEEMERGGEKMNGLLMNVPFPPSNKSFFKNV